MTRMYVRAKEYDQTDFDAYRTGDDQLVYLPTGVSMGSIFPESDLSDLHAKAIHVSKVNGHTPGNQFKHGIVFCKTCNALLTYVSYMRGKCFIAGLSDGSCK